MTDPLESFRALDAIDRALLLLALLVAWATSMCLLTWLRNNRR